MTTPHPTTRSRRPRNREDRDACLAATAGIEAATDLHPIVRAIATTAYVGARDAYLAACAANDAAAAAVTVARRERVAAEGRFDVAFRRWSVSVVDAEAKSLANELGVAFGVLPGDLLRKKTRTKLLVLRRTLPLLERSARLGGDPGRLEGLRAAIAPLDRAVAAFESAIRKRRHAVLRFEAAVTQFDRVYGTLAGAMLTYDDAPGSAAKVPVFHRAARRGGRVPDPERIARVGGVDDVDDVEGIEGIEGIDGIDGVDDVGLGPVGATPTHRPDVDAAADAAGRADVAPGAAGAVSNGQDLADGRPRPGSTTEEEG